MAIDSVTSSLPAAGSLAGDAAAKPKKSKSVKETKSKKPVAQRKSRSASSHPPFVVMITEAIVALKERTGSSQYAITKYVEGNHKQLPGNFRKLLLVQLKRLVASGKLVKVKNSFKLSPASAAKTKPKAKAPEKKMSEKNKPMKPRTVTGVKRKLATEKKSPAKKVRKTVTLADTMKTTKAPVKNLKKPKSLKSPVKKSKSLKSPAKKPRMAFGKTGKK